MIRRDRSKVEAPQILTDPTKAGHSERGAAEAFFNDPKNANDKFNFEAYKHPSIKAALGILFEHKCAYCESRYGATQPMDVEHWKPKAAVELADGRKITPGFYKLAAAWENLFPSCIDCNRRREQDDGSGQRRNLGKGNQFPVDAATPLLTIDDVDAAMPLLLNPCQDEPSEHLEFLDEGAVRAKQVAGETSRKGSASIETYALNRSELAAARREHALVILRQINIIYNLSLMLERGDTASIRGLLEELIHYEFRELERAKLDNQPYAQLTRQIVDRFASLLRGGDTT